MSRLTINEAAGTGYTDEIILTKNDFTGTAAGAETISIPVEKGDVVSLASIQVLEAVAGVGTAVIDIGDGSDADGFVDNANIAAAGTVSSGGALTNGATSNTKVYGAAGNIVITVTTGTTGMATATAGKVKVRLNVHRING
jgi:hypothetical protein